MEPFESLESVKELLVDLGLKATNCDDNDRYVKLEFIKTSNHLMICPKSHLRNVITALLRYKYYNAS